MRWIAVSMKHREMAPLTKCLTPRAQATVIGFPARCVMATAFRAIYPHKAGSCSIYDEARVDKFVNQGLAILLLVPCSVRAV